jgi:hypothetical protein
MIDGLAFGTSQYHKNAERVNGEKTPCAICGRAVNTDSSRTAWIHVHNGGASIVTEAEAKALNDAGREAADMCFYPVGSDCLKRHPELGPYVTRPTHAEPDGLVTVPGFGTSSY